MTHTDRFKAYLRHYADKDLSAIEAMFADDITLRDWKIFVQGKAHALAETGKNFDSAGHIDIQILEVFENANSVAAELKIVVNHTDILSVVDVITFQPDGLIQSIHAYLGRGDQDASERSATSQPDAN